MLTRALRQCFRVVVAVLLYGVLFLLAAEVIIFLMGSERIDGRWESTAFLVGLAAVILVVLLGVPSRTHRRRS